MQQLSAQSQVNQLHQQAIIQQIQQSLRSTSPATVSGTAGQHYLGPRQMPKIPGTGILTNPLDRLTNESILTEGQVDMLDIPGKGRCYVYIARFSYEPFQHSPNENPEAELPVQGGDYLLVWGLPDDDGFLDAETLDGRRGLVPANFVQKLVGDDLLDFHQAVLGLRDVDDSVSTNIPQVKLSLVHLHSKLMQLYNTQHKFSSIYSLYTYYMNKGKIFLNKFHDFYHYYYYYYYYCCRCIVMQKEKEKGDFFLLYNCKVQLNFSATCKT